MIREGRGIPVHSIQHLTPKLFILFCTLGFQPCLPSFYLLFMYLFILFFFQLHLKHMEVPGRELTSDCSHDLCHSCGNARSLTHCAKLGMEPALPQRQVGSLTHCAMQELFFLSDSFASQFSLQFSNLILYAYHLSKDT